VLLATAALLGSTPQLPALGLVVPSLQIKPATNDTVALTWHGPLPDAIQECSNPDSGAWTPVTNAPTQSPESDCELILPAQPEARFYRLVFGYVAQFETLGSSFAPRVDCAAGVPDTFRWTWSDGTTDTNWPAAQKDFGAPGDRLQRLTFSPGWAVTAINLGFDGVDEGWTDRIPAWPRQNVSAVNFAGPLTNLQLWASSYNPLTALDFTGFTALQCIDAFGCAQLARVVVTNLPSLRRACLENCRLTELDLSGDFNLEELRVANNLFTNIGLGGGVGPKVWHWCTRDNLLSQQLADFMTNFYSLRVFYDWNDNQAGLLRLISTNLTEVAAYSNHYASADFSGQRNLWLCEVFSNNLTNLVLDGCSGLQEVHASQNQLPATVLDRLLGQLDTNAPALNYADLTQNAEPPTSVGYTHYSNLMARGVAVYVDGR
jgi:hypothetical protein